MGTRPRVRVGSGNQEGGSLTLHPASFTPPLARGAGFSFAPILSGLPGSAAGLPGGGADHLPGGRGGFTWQPAGVSGRTSVHLRPCSSEQRVEKSGETGRKIWTIPPACDRPIRRVRPLRGRYSFAGCYSIISFRRDRGNPQSLFFPGPCTLLPGS